MPPAGCLRAAETLARAFFDDPVARYIHPGDTAMHRWLTAVFRVMVRFSQLYGRAEEADGFGGVSVWVAPRHVDAGAWKYLRASGMALGLHSRPGVLRRGLRFVGATQAVHRRCLHGPHWYLPFLGVEPGRQGRGIGTQLLRSVLDEADATGMACYLETTTERSLPLYERHGFETVEVGDIARGGPRLWAMVREARRTVSGRDRSW